MKARAAKPKNKKSSKPIILRPTPAPKPRNDKKRILFRKSRTYFFPPKLEAQNRAGGRPAAGQRQRQRQRRPTRCLAGPSRRDATSVELSGCQTKKGTKRPFFVSSSEALQSISNLGFTNKRFSILALRSWPM